MPDVTAFIVVAFWPSFIVLPFRFHLVYLYCLYHTCSMIKDKAEALKNLHTTSGMRFPQRTPASGNICRWGVECATARAKVLVSSTAVIHAVSSWLVAVCSEKAGDGFAGTTNSCAVQLCAHHWRMHCKSFELLTTVQLSFSALPQIHGALCREIGS